MNNYNEPKEWIIPCNANSYDIRGALKKLKILDWRQTKQLTNASVGDLVYLYCKYNGKGAIWFKGAILKVNKTEDFVDDSEFSLESNTYYDGRCMEIAMFREYDDVEDLTYDKLKEAGLKSKLQGAVGINESVAEYLHEIDKKQRAFDRFNGSIPDTCLVDFPIEIYEANNKDFIECVKEFNKKQVYIELKKVEQANKDREAFLQRFPVSKIRDMSMDDYLLGNGNKESFCYWIHSRLNSIVHLGRWDISRLYGVYYDNNGSLNVYGSGLGNDVKGAFATIKEEITKLLVGVENNDYSVVSNSKLHQSFKYKLLSIYFPEKVLPICTEGFLREICEKFGITYNKKDEMVYYILKLVEIKKSCEATKNWHNQLFLGFCQWIDTNNLYIPISKGISEKNYNDKTEYAGDLSNNELKVAAQRNESIKPKQYVSEVKQIERNPYIAEYAKRRANGICQLCGMPAPFNSPKTGEPYLESHHIIWLSDGGSDTIDNTVALCPNCHRKMHYVNDSEDVEKLKKVALNKNG